MVGVILFRAQPFHNGHLFMVKKALQDCMANNAYLYIFVGSANKEGTVRNPLPIELRVSLIEGSLEEVFTDLERSFIHIVPLDDLTDEADNSYEWGRYLYENIYKETGDDDITIYYSDRPEIMLGWFDADDRFNLRFKFLDRYKGITATKVRQMIMDNASDDELSKVVPNFVVGYKHIIKHFLSKPKNIVFKDGVEYEQIIMQDPNIDIKDGCYPISIFREKKED